MAAAARCRCLNIRSSLIIVAALEHSATASANRKRPSMKVPIKGAVDCDLHPALPSAPALLPYLDEYWRDQLVDRHIDRTPFNLTSYPPNSPLSARPDWRQPSGAARRRPRHDPPPGARPVRHALRHLQRAARRGRAVQRGHGDGAVLGGQRLGREGTARPRAAAARLDPGAGAQSGARGRARSSGVAPDRRFVQVLLLAMGEMLLGRRTYWPIYAAAEKHGLADRHPRRQHLSPRADGVGLAGASGGGLRRAIGGVRDRSC